MQGHRRTGQFIRTKKELYSKLVVAEEQSVQGDRGRPLGVVMKTLRKRIRELTVRHPKRPHDDK
jgi:hypothetical protein